MNRLAGFALGAGLIVASTAGAGPFEDGAAAFGQGAYDRALSLWQPLAEAGDAVAQFNLGVMHDQGRGVPRDAAQAEAWYGRAADQGDVRAAYNLGLMLEGRDREAAMGRYRQAAEAGDALAQYRLGELLSHGGASEREVAEAADWFEKAAEAGHAGAQFALGTLYAKGRGVRRNMSVATQWYARAEETSCTVGAAASSYGTRTTRTVAVGG